MAELMTKDEFRRALDELGMAQREAARFLQVNERTVRAWVSETDTAEPPTTAALVMLYLLGSKVSADEFADAVLDGQDRLAGRRKRRPVAA